MRLDYAETNTTNLAITRAAENISSLRVEEKSVLLYQITIRAQRYIYGNNRLTRGLFRFDVLQYRVGVKTPLPFRHVMFGKTMR